MHWSIRKRFTRCVLLLSALEIAAQGHAGAQVIAQPPIPSIINRVKVDPKRPIDFHAVVSPESLYVGQQATYQVAVFLDEEARQRLRRNPEFLPPELRGLLSYELGSNTRHPPRDVGGKRYEAHVFQRALFPIASGPITIPSAQLTYALPQSSSYFSREESYVVRAESANLVVRPLPELGKPADFTGAVGVLKSSARFDAPTARVGDPLVLTLRIQGTGNVKLLPRPTLEVEWASAVPGTERLQVDTSGPLVRGAKEFDWILTPARAGDVVTPVIRYSYFNPYVGRYEVAETAPIPLSVRTGSLATNSSEEEPVSLMSLRPRDRGSVSDPITDRAVFWLYVAILPLPALLLLRRRTPRARKPVSPVDALQRLARNMESADKTKNNAEPRMAQTLSAIGATRRTFMSALAVRLGVSVDVLTERARVERTLRRRGVTTACTSEVLSLLDRLDRAAFGAESSSHETPAVTADESMLARQAMDLYQQVDDEALHASIAPLPEVRRSAAVSRLMWILSAGTALAFGDAALRHDAALAQGATFTGDPFASASSAYDRRQFREAADRFHDMVAIAPRDPDLLANWGTAAWAAGDTVGAVMAWQRAARLDPLAEDMQQRLALLPAGARGGVAEVPLIPVNWLATTSAVFWLIGWGITAFIGWRLRRQRSPELWLKVAATVSLITAVAAGGIAVWGASALGVHNLAVVVRPETMRSSPDGESDAVGGAATGDVVRITQRDPMWYHVRHSDGRSGWLPAHRLIALTDDRPLR